VVHLNLPPLRERKEDILHLAHLFLRQFAALHRRPARHFTAAAEEALEDYGWPGNVRELENIVLASVLLCDTPAVDVGDLQGFQGAEVAGGVATETRSRPDGPPSTAVLEDGSVMDPIARLRKALGHEIALALQSGGAPAPLGKWLMDDLVLAADRLSGGTQRRAAELLGVPETTLRRQLRAALTRRAAGLSIRSASWPAVAGILEDLVRSRPREARTWAEASLLAEIETAAPGNVRLGGALVGVTEATFLRRRNQKRQF
jgi:DNA-binding NtrC family response regulator